ncbi:MAG: endonuclease III [Candidatus Puniceispirillales bacterium]
MTAADIEKVFVTLAGIMPEPKTELEFENPYTLLVAVALSAQATDVSVNKATKALFREVKTPEAMLALGIDRLKDHIKTIGLYNTKAANVMKMAALLIRDHGGEVPQDRDSLEALPGVGRKTANVVLNEAFGVPTIAVDTHIFRVGNRTGMAVGSTPLAVEKLLEKRVPELYRKAAHHWLILHGRYTCVARKPKCGACPIIDQCRYRHKTEF